MSKKFPDILIKKEKGSRSVFYTIAFDLESARYAKAAEEGNLDYEPEEGNLMGGWDTR